MCLKIQLAEKKKEKVLPSLSGSFWPAGPSLPFGRKAQIGLLSPAARTSTTLA
jgi:hypothetical protein